MALHQVNIQGCGLCQCTQAVSEGICMGDPYLVITHFAERVFARAYKHGVFERIPVHPPNLVN